MSTPSLADALELEWRTSSDGTQTLSIPGVSCDLGAAGPLVSNTPLSHKFRDTTYSELDGTSPDPDANGFVASPLDKSFLLIRLQLFGVLRGSIPHKFDRHLVLQRQALDQKLESFTGDRDNSGSMNVSVTDGTGAVRAMFLGGLVLILAIPKRRYMRDGAIQVPVCGFLLKNLIPVSLR